jgi:hypothetical protein
LFGLAIWKITRLINLIKNKLIVIKLFGQRHRKIINIDTVQKSEQSTTIRILKPSLWRGTEDFK